MEIFEQASDSTPSETAEKEHPTGDRCGLFASDLSQRKDRPILHIVGGGLAGVEAAWQALNRGVSVILHEMRPVVMTPAHKTGDLAELVCSNSLKAMSADSAPGRLKEEMQAFQSLVIAAAYKAQVPAGGALAVDRRIFSEEIAKALGAFANFRLELGEVTRIPSEAELAQSNEWWIVASGPLTSDALARELEALCGEHQRLYFYDAIAPVLAADSLNLDAMFRANRNDDEADGDYLNIPLDKAQYEAFVEAIALAEKMPLHNFEKATYFEACLPLEVMVERGKETLRFGPMKPVGLVDPKTGRRPYANIQLRIENASETMFSMVGFQTKMKWPDQKRVFSMLPGLEEVEILRYGSVHRNTYVDSPNVLNKDFSFRANKRVFLAGQVSGVEGYTESAAIGLVVGRIVAAKTCGVEFSLPPAQTMLGALAHYVTFGVRGKYAPMNANLGLLPASTLSKGKGVGKAARKAQQCELARETFNTYLQGIKSESGVERQSH